MTTTNKRLLCLNRHAPHGTIHGQESLDLVLIASAFNQEISLAFMDDGVFQLVKDWQTEIAGLKNYSKTFRALEMHDVEKIYVHQPSLQARGLSCDDLLIEVELLNDDELSQLIEQQDQVFPF